MGLLIMLIVTLIFFFILKWIIGTTLGAAGISCAILIGWFLLNIRAGTTGLIKANMRAYFVQRSRGTSHKEAMERVIKSRYPLSQENQVEVKAMFDSIASNVTTEEGELKNLVYMILSYESGSPPTVGWTTKVLQKIDDVYESMNRRYGLIKSK